MALMNKKLAPEIEMVCFITSQDYLFVKSSTIKEIARLGGDLNGVYEALRVRGAFSSSRLSVGCAVIYACSDEGEPNGHVDTAHVLPLPGLFI
jgi:hypothetical protein